MQGQPLWCFDAMASGAWRWFEPKTTGRVPEPRAAMAHAVMDGEFVIAGGWDGKTAFDDAYSLDLSTFRWRKHSFSGMCDASLSDRIFFGHTSSPEGLIFVHGGASPKNLNDMFDDVMTFDAKTSKLCRLRTSGNGPGLRCRQANAYMNGYLYAFGGHAGKGWLESIHRLDVDSAHLVGGGSTDGVVATWEEITAKGFKPYPRAHACLIPWPLPQPRLLLYGGGDGDTDFAATYVMDTHTHYWTRLTNVRAVPSPLLGHHLRHDVRVCLARSGDQCDRRTLTAPLWHGDPCERRPCHAGSRRFRRGHD